MNRDGRDIDDVKHIPLGELLISAGVLDKDHLQQALLIQKEWGTRLGDILLAKGWVRALDFYQVLADHYELPFINLMEESVDNRLLNESDIGMYAEHLILPWREKGGRLTVVMADPGPEAMAFASQHFGKDIDFAVTSKFDIMWMLQENNNSFLSHQAVYALSDNDIEMSARQVFTGRQLIVIYSLMTFFLLALTMYPIGTLVTVNFIIAVFLLVNFGLRAFLTWVGGDRHIDIKVTDNQVSILDDKELPTYTILVPMYKEPEVIQYLASSLRKLDYPLSKLDIKLILEEDDDETIEAAKKLGLEGIFEIIRVPDSLPKTKPKACNYALHFARGEYVTIYDAEDRPEPDQLKKAVVAFRAAPDNTVCIQARLNYFNANENWLTRMFTLEYSLWFDFYLPALEALKIPIPLGGTSNHFKMDVLREVGAWDPFNVTEDADLGVRITQMGYRVGVVNSTTFEEANSRYGNWIRQRSRWIKGYMQTYLVHMRSPIKLYASLGHVGFWGFQFFIGGAVLSTLLAPLLYAMYIMWLITDTHAYDIVFPPLVLYISLINLLVGNGYLIYLSMLGAFKRHLYSLIPFGLTMPFYWLMMSVAAYKALWQLIHNPFYWEKTLHGITNYNSDETEEKAKDVT
ncbi:MAG: glycosyltransferase [Gammaproteobacteria bacterium]|nr:glycosyltransferase [Gammaproteobacteria bacterium]